MKDSNPTLLVPIYDICQIPPLEKVAQIARMGHFNIHIAGFIRGRQKPGRMIEQSMRLLRIMRVIVHRLKKKVKKVTSKIYPDDDGADLRKNLGIDSLRLVVTKKINKELIDLKRQDHDLCLLQVDKKNPVVKKDLNKDYDVKCILDHLSKIIFFIQTKFLSEEDYICTHISLQELQRKEHAYIGKKDSAVLVY